MQLIVSGQTGSPGIHYMVLDIMVVLLDWSSVAIPQVGHHANPTVTMICHIVIDFVYYCTIGEVVIYTVTVYIIL